MQRELGAQPLPDVLAHGLTALAGGSLYRSGETGLDLQPEQCVSSDWSSHRKCHRVAVAWL
ncbi:MULTISPECIES: hypothetical protein [unclassified Methylobacterium]|uniref:hypothetical protein n=1 Tax=unclassified Methylobacterium TaxID=2615210 RepID=UPI00226A86AA|nr:MULTISPECIES: hypothetical protein [unclassified Methylobacterium]